MNIPLKLSAIAFVTIVSICSIGCTEKKYSKYGCPMKCENEKTYNQPGKCPVCGMKLKGIE
ncbi:MAG: hypothetical protein JST82_09880 [Bacteroidetes bacterium]|nr:hypothetical protein [Bacteroidota bacterium]